MADASSAIEVHLEAMRASDCSWHPCEVSLRSSGGLAVHFGGIDLEEEIHNEDELFARLRVRSLPLEGDDCHRIGEGEHVLATTKLNSKSLFFDAVVEEVRLVRHSKRIVCRCTLVIKWMHQNPECDNVVVPSSSIKKYSGESIRIHPVVAAFLNSVKKLSSSNGACSTLDESYADYDANRALEKQIEEIGNLADVLTRERSEATIVKANHDFHKGDVKEVSGNEGRQKRSSDRNRIKTKTESKDPEPAIMTSLEEPPVNRSPLNPLAARAALAKLMSKLPEKLEFSFCVERENVLEPNGATHESFSTELMNGTRFSSGFGSYREVAGQSVSPSCATNVENFPKTVRSTRLTRSAVKNGTQASMKDVQPGYFERNMESKISDAVRPHVRSEGKGLQNDNRRSQKRKEQPSQSSPQLNSRPRTRSQARS